MWERFAWSTGIAGRVANLQEDTEESVADRGGSGAAKPLVNRPENLTEQVYRVIKQRIVSGHYTQGERLVERKLAEELNVSKTPVREALARLERERLVVSVPDRGIEVKTLTPEEVEYILEIRKLLEGYFARKATPRITEKDVKKLNEILKASSRAVKKGDWEAYKECDIQFHGLIRDKSGNVLAAEIMSSLENQIRLLMSTSVHLPDRAAASFSCHSRILEAFRRKDETAAEEAARTHIENVKQAVIAFLASADGNVDAEKMKDAATPGN